MTLFILVRHLHRDKYVIQTWFRGADPWLYELLNRGYRVILSNSDAWYLDCGLDQWTWDGRAADSNWCSPYKGWRTMYENSPRKMVDRFGIPWEDEAKPLVMGGEAPMWSEQVNYMGPSRKESLYANLPCAG